MVTTMNNELLMYIGFLPRIRIDLNYVFRMTFCKNITANEVAIIEKPFLHYWSTQTTVPVLLFRNRKCEKMEMIPFRYKFAVKSG